MSSSSPSPLSSSSSSASEEEQNGPYFPQFQPDALSMYVDNLANQYLDQMYQNYSNRTNVASESSSRRRTRRTRTYIERGREEGHDRLVRDYFSDNPIYTDAQFRRRFRMQKPLFLRLVNQLSSEVEYFQQRPDCTGRIGLSPIQKCTAAMRMLAYGVPADNVDDYVRIGETTARRCLHEFVHAVVALFGPEYLRRPTPEDLQRLLVVGNNRGFPGMIGSIDCMHWEWKNCPYSWRGQYVRGDQGRATKILETVTSYDL